MHSMGMESFNASPQEPTPEPPLAPKEDLTRFFSTNPREVLGVPANASVEDIEIARKNLQRKFHPDVNRDPKAKEIAQNINNAFDVLNGKGEHAVLGGHSASKTKEDVGNPNEMIIATAEMEFGTSVSHDTFVEIMEYGRLRNVRVDFFIKKELPLSKVYKVEFKGKRKDIQTVVDYIRNRPRVKL